VNIVGPVTPSTHLGDEHQPMVVFDPEAARRWLADGAATGSGINESFSTVNLTIAAGLDDLLRALDDEPEPQVWAVHPPATRVLLWRTADGDGVDGGGVIAAELRFGEHTLRLASRPRDHDDFVEDNTLSGIDAAVQALARVADVINQDVAQAMRVFGHLAQMTETADTLDQASPTWSTRSPASATALVGISAVFDPAEIEALIITAAEAVHGQPDDLSLRQLELTARAYALLQDFNDN
jgi:hypothetical protein